jgi:5-methyltetrahydrofolate--homocysteine methyltransferase
MDWDKYTPMTPNFIGQNNRSRLRGPSSLYRLDPIFRTWQLFGKYPAILTDDVVGEEATLVLQIGNVKVILKEKKLTAKGIYGIFPANQVNDDDIELTAQKGKLLEVFLTLRQQAQKQKERQISLYLIL